MASPHRRSPLRLLAAAVAFYCILRRAQADDEASELPGDWRTGIATNYGGAQDGMVRDLSQPACRPGSGKKLQAGVVPCHCLWSTLRQN